MSDGRVARYGRARAKAGRGAELAEKLLAAAEREQDDPGCELYLVNRQKDEPDVVWVTELWRDQAALDASVARLRGEGAADVSAVMALVEDFGMVELDLLGGKGP